MCSAEKSLRLLVTRWLTPTLATPIRVTEFSRTYHRNRYVRVEALRSEGAVALFFCRHDDGTWRVFPPEAERLTIRIVERFS
ncbi:hypothetical protein P0D75_25025 [Paraburkholderia sediminicola]